MVGMPVSTDIELLVWFLADLGNLWVRLDRYKEPVYVDGRPPLRPLDVLIFGQVLISKEDHAVVHKRLANLGELLVTNARGYIHVANLRADSRARWRDSN